MTITEKEAVTILSMMSDALQYSGSASLLAPEQSLRDRILKEFPDLMTNQRRNFLWRVLK